MGGKGIDLMDEGDLEQDNEMADQALLDHIDPPERYTDGPRPIAHDPSIYDEGENQQRKIGERAYYSRCRHCLLGVTVRNTKDGGVPEMLDYGDACLLGVPSADEEELQQCSAFFPRSLSIVAHLNAWFHRRAVRKAAVDENQAAIDSSYQSDPLKKPFIPSLKEILKRFVE